MVEVGWKGRNIRLASAQVSIGLIGAGDFARSTLLPAIRQIEGLERVGVCAASGAHSRHAAAKFGFRYCATDPDRVFVDPAINTVVIATRHHHGIDSWVDEDAVWIRGTVPKPELCGSMPGMGSTRSADPHTFESFDLADGGQ